MFFWFLMMTTLGFTLFIMMYSWNAMFKITVFCFYMKYSYLIQPFVYIFGSIFLGNLDLLPMPMFDGLVDYTITNNNFISPYILCVTGADDEYQLINGISSYYYDKSEPNPYLPNIEEEVMGPDGNYLESTNVDPNGNSRPYASYRRGYINFEEPITPSRLHYNSYTAAIHWYHNGFNLVSVSPWIKFNCGSYEAIHNHPTEADLDSIAEKLTQELADSNPTKNFINQNAVYKSGGNWMAGRVYAKPRGT